MKQLYQLSCQCPVHLRLKISLIYVICHLMDTLASNGHLQKREIDPISRILHAKRSASQHVGMILNESYS